jgi:RNA polymerase sigma-B factor
MQLGKRAYSDAEVTDMVLRYRSSGDSRLRDQVVERMRPLVRSLARKFAGREPVEDLESEGFVGLLRAIDQFSATRGARFSTYATHLIAGHIRHYLRDRGHLIRQPAWLQELSSKVDRATAELEQKLHREPTLAEIAAATNLTEDGIEELQAARRAAEMVRMEAPTDDDDEYLLVDPEKIKSRSYVTLELPIEDRIVVENALGKLKELERKVLYYFYYQDYSQSEIARKLGISCNYTGHLLRNGLKHMKEGLPAEQQPAARRKAHVGETVLDPVTGLYTREHFERRLSEEIARAQRYEHPLSLCCLRLPTPLDETALANAADELRGRIRRVDIAARTGTAEFGVIFPHTDEAALRVAQKLASHLEGLVSGPVQTGVACYPEGGRTAPELCASAREASYAERAALPV